MCTVTCNKMNACIFVLRTVDLLESPRTVPVQKLVVRSKNYSKILNYSTKLFVVVNVPVPVYSIVICNCNAHVCERGTHTHIHDIHSYATYM